VASGEKGNGGKVHASCLDTEKVFYSIS